MVTGALWAVAAGNVPVVASGAFSASAGFVVAFGLAAVLADLTMELDHMRSTIVDGSRLSH